jgi:hypothetical protein
MAIMIPDRLMAIKPAETAGSRTTPDSSCTMIMDINAVPIVNIFIRTIVDKVNPQGRFLKSRTAVMIAVGTMMPRSIAWMTMVMADSSPAGGVPCHAANPAYTLDAGCRVSSPS